MAVPLMDTRAQWEPHLARAKEAILAVVDSGRFVLGPAVAAFESEAAAALGCGNAIGVANGTDAISIVLRALGVGPGDEVIVPTWTFAASAEVVVYRGAIPVLVDIDPADLNATPQSILDAVTPRTKAVLVVHVAGRPMAIGELVAELGRRGIPVVEDAAHSFPSPIAALGGRFAGTIGRIGAFSFYATKTITTGEGGMFVTDDDALADRARLMSLHGISRHAWNRYTAAGTWAYEIEDAGYKYNMTDMAAALGLAQLSRAQELLAARRSLAKGYAARFERSPIGDLLDLPSDAPDGSHAWHLFIVRLHLDRLTIDRAAVMEGLRERGIGASVHFIPLHQHPYYRARPETTPRALPNAEREFWRVVSLPIWPGMTDQDQDRVVAALEDILAPARR